MRKQQAVASPVLSCEGYPRCRSNRQWLHPVLSREGYPRCRSNRQWLHPGQSQSLRLLHSDVLKFFKSPFFVSFKFTITIAYFTILTKLTLIDYCLVIPALVIHISHTLDIIDRIDINGLWSMLRNSQDWIYLTSCGFADYFMTVFLSFEDLTIFSLFCLNVKIKPSRLTLLLSFDELFDNLTKKSSNSNFPVPAYVYQL